MQEQVEKSKRPASTLDVQEMLYERRLKEMQRREGLDRSEIIEQVNNPEIHKTVSKTKKR